MIYKPMTCVWEVTMGCNMNCGHCGSSCAAPLPGELTTDEAYDLIEQLSEIGLRWVTLSGGEPTTRKDLPLLVKRLHECGVSVNIITNGWLMDEALAKALKENGVYTVAVSIDGTKDIHDSIRKEGSFERAKNAISLLKAVGIKTGAITTISKLNLPILSDLHDELVDMGVESWQLQIGLPMGNMSERPEWLIEPEIMEDIINFCYDAALRREITVYPADCIGYYTEKESIIHQISFNTNDVNTWDGCNAGLRSFGVLHNGDILGCTSIRNREYVEGNIKEKRLAEIWYGADNFKWRRDMTKKDLDGICSICTYGNKCLGGCPNTRLTMNGTIKSENRYCAYNVACRRFMSAIGENADELLAEAKSKAQEGKLQTAAFLAGHVTELCPDNAEAYALKGFTEFMCGNYELCEQANRKRLELVPDDPYATKGLGLSLHKQGRSAEGLELLEKAAKATDWRDMDIINDLMVVRHEYKK